MAVVKMNVMHMSLSELCFRVESKLFPGMGEEAEPEAEAEMGVEVEDRVVVAVQLQLQQLHAQTLRAGHCCLHTECPSCSHVLYLTVSAPQGYTLS